jgi:hypothetical protein
LSELTNYEQSKNTREIQESKSSGLISDTTLGQEESDISESITSNKIKGETNDYQLNKYSEETQSYTFINSNEREVSSSIISDIISNPEDSHISDTIKHQISESIIVQSIISTEIVSKTYENPLNSNSEQTQSYKESSIISQITSHQIEENTLNELSKHNSETISGISYSHETSSDFINEKSYTEGTNLEQSYGSKSTRERESYNLSDTNKETLDNTLLEHSNEITYDSSGKIIDITEIQSENNIEKSSNIYSTTQNTIFDSNSISTESIDRTNESELSQSYIIPSSELISETEIKSSEGKIESEETNKESDTILT